MLDPVRVDLYMPKDVREKLRVLGKRNRRSISGMVVELALAEWERVESRVCRLEDEVGQ